MSKIAKNAPWPRYPIPLRYRHSRGCWAPAVFHGLCGTKRNGSGSGSQQRINAHIGRAQEYDGPWLLACAVLASSTPRFFIKTQRPALSRNPGEPGMQMFGRGVPCVPRSREPGRANQYERANPYDGVSGIDLILGLSQPVVKPRRGSGGTGRQTAEIAAAVAEAEPTAFGRESKGSKGRQGP
jgi:hypothetical protein